MKRLNKKGFTLIELLAVIVIMGILMMVAIPAMSTYINNSRKDTFASTAKEYGNAVKNAWASDGIECNGVSSGAVESNKTYYVLIDTKATAGAASKNQGLLESGGKSSWSNDDVQGYVSVELDTNSRPTYSILLVDYHKHGIKNATEVDKVDGDSVDVSGATYGAPAEGSSLCSLK